MKIQILNGNRLWAPLSMVLLPCLLTSPGSAQENKSDKGPLAGINACRTIADLNQRVTCYDSAVDGLNSAIAKKDVTIVDKATVKEAKRGLFGFSFGDLKLFGGSENSGDQNPEEREMTADIKSARALGDGRWRFTLQTGAVWETTENLKGIHEPKGGISVTLEKGVLGSYFATFGKGPRTRAKRVN